jgi:hypothetical protein
MRRPPLPSLTAIALGVAFAVSGCAGSGSASPTPPPPASLATASSDPSVAATPSPNSTLPAATMTPWATPTPAQSAKPANGTWTYDVYDARAVRWQDPDLSACTAASALIMLNMAMYWHDYTSLAAGRANAKAPTQWKPTVLYTTQESVLAYQRKTGTMLLSWRGADAHGWRNALNYYGWGSTKAGVFKDQSFTSFDTAVQSTVRAIALFRKPVGILAWAGDHAQIVTGYKVTGEDPRTGGTAFTVIGVYVTDPLKGDGLRDKYVALATLRSGAKTIRFRPYLMTNSPYIDPLDGKQGNAEWDNKWVIVGPVA